MTFILKEINSKSELKKFVNFPFELYKNTKQWVPPLVYDEISTLMKSKNPAFEFCEARYWMVSDNDKIVGRIAGIINHKFIELWGKKAIRFGWVDFIENEEVFKMLIDAVISWGKEKNLEIIHGPLGFTDFDYEGMLIEGFDEIGTMSTIYNFPYYQKFIEKNGFEKEVDWLEFEITVPDKIPDKAVRIANIVKEKFGIKLFEAKKSKDFIPYGKEIFYLINEAYKNLFGFVPLTERQIDKYIKQYLGFVVPDLLKLLLDSQGKVAGFVIGMPSLTKALQKTKGKLFPFGFIHFLRAVKKNRYADLFLGAIRPDLQGKGADALLITELTKSCIARGIITAESNIELESNHLVQSHWKLFNTRQHKRRRCYLKNIS